MGQGLRQEVPGLIVDKSDNAQTWIERAQAAIAAGGFKIERPQLLVVVDRNPRVQQMRIVLARSDGRWQSLGGSKVSTGRPQGYEHFLTPTGVFPHTRRILDWWAEGTFNENHVRGLGVEGTRVWDFGWASAQRLGTSRRRRQDAPAIACHRPGNAGTADRACRLGRLRARPDGDEPLSRHPRRARYRLRACRAAERSLCGVTAPRPSADATGRQCAGDHRLLAKSGATGFQHAYGRDAEPLVCTG